MHQFSQSRASSLDVWPKPRSPTQFLLTTRTCSLIVAFVVPQHAPPSTASPPFLLQTPQSLQWAPCATQTSLGDPNWCIECSIKYQAVISNSIVIYNYGSNMIKLDSNPKSLYHRNIGSCLNNLLRSWCILLLDQHGGYKSVWHTCDTEYDASQALECLASFRHSLFGPIGQWPLRNEGPKEFHGTTWNLIGVPFSFRDYQVGLVALHLLRSLPFSSNHKQPVVQSLCGCSGNRSCNKCRAVQKQAQGGITIWKIGQFTRLLPADVVETQVLPPPESRLDQTTSDDCRNKGELLSMPKLNKIQ